MVLGNGYQQINMTSKQYSQMDPITHILKRPDMYCGSKRFREVDEYITEDMDFNISRQPVQFCPALTRIFIEVLSNATDNVERSRTTKTPCTSIHVSIDPNTGETSVWNDGDVVPIEKNVELDCYNHSMIFGRLLTGSNYNDEEERLVAGRNGLGSKLCNVFSSRFTVEGCDPNTKKILTQTWVNNMRSTDGPTIVRSTRKTGYTKVTWIPDFAQFGLTGYTDSVVNLYRRYVIDAAMISGVKVYLNNKIVKVDNLDKYSRLYNCDVGAGRIAISTPTCHVLLTPSSGEFEAVSFVNGVYTKLGGQHVDSWAESFFRPIVDKINGKNKTAKRSGRLNISDVKRFFRLFVVSTVVRPEFDGQDKNKLESPSVHSTVSDKNISAIMKWSVIDQIEDILRAKEMSILKKTEKKHCKIDGYDPANNAGGKLSSNCTLIVCEGLSAKTYAVAGIQHGVYGKKGRDDFGILPLTGKILNVRNAAVPSIAANKGISNLVGALGARYGVDYTKSENYKTLNYGRLMIMTDADCDGIHIEGLVMNFIHALFPTLLNRDEPFIVSMKTPIARVIKPSGSKVDLLFYDERRFNEWISEQGDKKFRVKYYKGLGTTKIEDIPDTFGLKMVEYKEDADALGAINKVFHKNNADSRKAWLGNYIPSAKAFSLDDQGDRTDMTVSDFMNGEMIKFSHADCARSIPNGIDGLKESQRKILYAVKKRKLRYGGASLKVAQLSGYTAEHSNYHHGEQNLQDTIIGMANEFPGSNNIPLFFRDGQFGSRLDGGHDAASARYIFTKMDMLTDLIFKDEDEPILDFVNDDGDLVQPEFYLPILPMILVNGAMGIGTGWSSSIPCHNPIDIIAAIRAWLKSPADPKLPVISPWYRGFTGEISPAGPNKFTSKGIMTNGSEKDTVVITEIPIGVWTNKYKEFLEDLISEKKLKSMKNYSTPTTVKFVVKQHQSTGMLCTNTNMKLSANICLTNMVAFDEFQQIKKYETVNDILIGFCETRFKGYEKRKQHQLRALTDVAKLTGQKLKFIKSVISKELVIFDTPEASIIERMKNMGFEMIDESFNHLLNISVRSFTAERVIALTRELDDLDISKRKIEQTSPSEMRLTDLKALEIGYVKFLKTV